MNEIMSDEEYLLSQALDNLETNLTVAKSWMIFSKSVFPKSFPILFQCYKLERDENNSNECALILHDLIKMFQHEIAFIDELRCFAHAMCSDKNDFYKEIFKQLSNDDKYDIMLAATKTAESIDEHCKFMVSFLKYMPSARFSQYGSDVIDRLLAAEKGLQTWTPVNKFRKMLVTDVLPLILKVSDNEFKFEHLFHLLEKAIEFYIWFLFYCNSQNLVDEDLTMLSASSRDEGWKPLLKLLETVALQSKWNYTRLHFSESNELSLKNLVQFLKKKNKLFSLKSSKLSFQNKLDYEETYFCLVITFFYYLYKFGRLIHLNMFSGLTTGQYNYILMEGISFSSNGYSDILPSDFIQTEKGYFFISKCESKEANDMLICSFVTAVDCWELLHQHSFLRHEFKKLCTNFKLETWPIFQEFNLNFLIIKESHEDVVSYLENIRCNAVNLELKTKMSLQIASSYYFLKKYEQSVTNLFDIIMKLPLATTIASVKMPVIKSSVRYLYFMGCNNTEIIQYCVSVLLKLYKSQWHAIPDYYKCMAVSYVLVLLQYSVDQEYVMLKKCTKFIKKAKTFCFPKFFNYIINVHILEEISHLLTSSGGNVNLEILPDLRPQANELCAVSRNVNGIQEKLKLAFVSQMARCNESLDNIYIEFIKKEHHFLLVPLVHCM